MGWAPEAFQEVESLQFQLCLCCQLNFEFDGVHASWTRYLD